VWRFAGGWHGWLKYHGIDPKDAPRGLKVGDYFPACRLVVLKGEADRKYLDLPPGTKSFALSELPSDYLLVEMFSELCSGCLKEVPEYNRLYELVEADSYLGGRLKIIGLGAGSSRLAVVRFRRQNKVLFPLFADRNKEVFSCLGEPEMPVAYLLYRQGEGYFRILMIQSEHIESPEAFVNKIKKILGAD
jgi:thiol-disulfide isomerase/thioredoxin